MNPLQARYPEAFEYLRARGVEPSADFYERVETARKQAWTMSKLSDLDHIQRIKDSLEKAIAEGMSFENWRKENLADLQGLPKSYQETVFRTAVQSSYNAGRTSAITPSAAPSCDIPPSTTAAPARHTVPCTD